MPFPITGALDDARNLLGHTLAIDAEQVCKDREQIPSFGSFPITREYEWSEDAKHIFIGMLSLMPDKRVEEYFSYIREVMKKSGDTVVTRKHFERIARKFYSDNDGKIFYFLNKLSRVR